MGPRARLCTKRRSNFQKEILEPFFVLGEDFMQVWEPVPINKLIFTF